MLVAPYHRPLVSSCAAALSACQDGASATAATACPFPAAVKRPRLDENSTFDESPLQLKTRVTSRMVASEAEKRRVEEHTQAMLMAAAQVDTVPLHRPLRASRRLTPRASSVATVQCHACRQVHNAAHSGVCAFCEKPSCANCGQACATCQHFFCGFCAQYRYDRPQEEWSCLGCLHS